MKNLIKMEHNGIVKEYELLFTYVSSKTNKKYIAYRDPSKVDDDDQLIYTACYDLSSSQIVYEPLDNDEINMMNHLLNKIRDSYVNGGNHG